MLFRSISAMLQDTEPDDLIRFGLIPELVGRLPVLATLDELNEAALVDILVRPKNALIKQYQKLLSLDGVDLEFEPAAVKQIADLAIERKMGARGLRTIIENAMMDIMYRTPSESDISKVIITPETITGMGEPKVVRRELEEVADDH